MQERFGSSGAIILRTSYTRMARRLTLRHSPRPSAGVADRAPGARLLRGHTRIACKRAGLRAAAGGRAARGARRGRRGLRLRRPAGPNEFAIVDKVDLDCRY